MAQPSQGSNDVSTSAVDEEVVRELPTYPYANEYEYENGPAPEHAHARANTATATATAPDQTHRQLGTTRTTQVRRNWVRDPNHNGVMAKTRTGIRTTSNSSPIGTVKHDPATRSAAFNQEFSSAGAGAGPQSQAMQTYSTRQVSTTMNGAGEIQSQHEVSTEQLGQGHLHASNSGLKLKLDLNLDVEVELKAKIHGDLTLALL
ncbi:hypothetical protein BDW71DRAFT_208645 [Aspergillus fruticulosus]